MPKRPTRSVKLTDTVRVAALKPPLEPSIAKDSEIAGFQLIVTSRDVFWVQFLQPRGRDPDGKRWRVVRHKLGDARTMTADEARAAALAAKVASRQGKDPHRERLASLASSVAQRSIVPQSVGEAAALYAQSVGARSRLSDRTRRATIR